MSLLNLAHRDTLGASWPIPDSSFGVSFQKACSHLGFFEAFFGALPASIALAGGASAAALMITGLYPPAQADFYAAAMLLTEYAPLILVRPRIGRIVLLGFNCGGPT